MKWFKRIGTLVAGLLIGTTAFAQGYPNKPVRIVVAYQAGQGTDVVTRFIAEQLTKALGQSFFIENRGGAGGNIGTEAVARAAADGYTLTMGTNATHALNQFLYATLPFNPEKDFEPIILVGTFPMVVLAGVESPIKSIDDLITRVKANPRAGRHRAAEHDGAPRLRTPEGAQPGAAVRRALQGLVGGAERRARRPDSAGDRHRHGGPQPGGERQAARARRDEREADRALPGARTVAEQGLPGFEVIAWNALYAPKGTPPAIIKQLNAEVAKILAAPETRQRLIDIGFEPAGGSPEQLAEFARAERDKWGPLIKKADIKAE